MAILLLGALALGACQHGLKPPMAAGVAEGGTAPKADGAPQPPARVSRDFYPIFYDQKAHLESLVKDGNFADADRLLEEQQDWFAANRDKALPVLEEVAAHFNGQKKAGIGEALTQVEGLAWPAGRDRWTALRKALQDARAQRDGYAKPMVLRDAAFKSPEATKLEEVLEAKEGLIRKAAPEQFAAFPHFGEEGFFAVFPVKLDGGALFRENPGLLEKALAAAKAAEVQKFAANYPLEAIGIDARKAVGERLMAAIAKESGGKQDLASVLGAHRAAKQAGFDKVDLKGVKIAFVEVTSHTLLKHKQIEFSASVDVDLPVETAKAELDDALSNSTAQAADYIVVFDVAMAKASRRMTKSEAVRSRQVVGTEKEPNPEWDLAQMEIGAARDDLSHTRFQNTMNNYSYSSNPYASPGAGLIGALGGMIAQGIAANELEKRKMKLLSTPRYIEKPVYADYDYQKVQTKGTKTMTVNYYVIDRRNKTYFKDTLDVVERRNFDVVYNVADNDPDKDRNRSSGDTEATVDEWERASSAVKLSQLVDHYLANRKAAKPLPSHEALRKEMLADKNVALAKHKEERIELRPKNDARFDHVVAIYMPGKGGLGSGFFVTPDVVMTNYHVVKEMQFAEMKLYDGQESFGKIFAKDVRLDLALVKVQSRGKPVKLYSGSEIDLGTTVEAIGHPRGFEFSITRGVVSAVRKGSGNDFKGNKPSHQMVGGKDVLYLQIDAPISPGNSGGPLFLGDKVVGVNTWGRTDAQNLNFAVHYSEVAGFLREYMPEYAVKAN
ncbi:MAG: S1C family serine protease [Magnetospirillum sp. WYHS-4]